MQNTMVVGGPGHWGKNEGAGEKIKRGKVKRNNCNLYYKWGKNVLKSFIVINVRNFRWSSLHGNVQEVVTHFI